MNILSYLPVLLNFKSDPVGSLVQLVQIVGVPALKSKIQDALKNRISPTGRTQVADTVAAIAAAIRAGDNAKAADGIVSLIEGIK